MNLSKSFLQQLDEAVQQGSAESRENALWFATDMLIIGRYSEDEIWVFGEVIGRLADAIEVAARARLARQVARTTCAPANIVRKLAFDDSIDVAGPVLEDSERLDPATLVGAIRTKSQQHQLAISKRKSIPTEVTDELVTRGDHEVITSVASNKGACFSDFGFLHMIKRSGNDSILAETLGLRKDIPRPMFQQLIAKASVDVRHKLERERPDLAVQIHTSITEVAGALHSKFGPATNRYFVAKRMVTARHQVGQLNEGSILEYARDHKIEEATVGLSLLCSLPVNVVERALADREMTLILAKARDFKWETTMSLLFLGAKDHRIRERDLDHLKEEFTCLGSRTSQDVLDFYQARRHALSTELDADRLPRLRTL
jgi:uncharacterized protein (DUF2336 family)